jgi:hypothetical protein
VAPRWEGQLILLIVFRVWSRIGSRNHANPKLRVVAAVRSEALARVLGHLLVEADEFQSFIGVSGAEGLLGEISCLAPDVIVVTLPGLGSEPVARIAELKAALPASRLILITSAQEDEASRESGADAQVPAEALVGTLVAEIRKLARNLAGGRRPRDRA